jgi:hypothetical protein
LKSFLKNDNGEFCIYIQTQFESSEEKLFNSSIFPYFLSLFEAAQLFMFTLEINASHWTFFLLLLYASPCLWLYGYFLCTFESFCLSFCPLSWIDKFEMIWSWFWGVISELLVKKYENFGILRKNSNICLVHHILGRLYCPLELVVCFLVYY